MIRILIVDDSPILRNGLKTIIKQDNEIKVMDSAENGQEALEMCKKILPDLVLMDIRMPICDGVEGTRLIKEFNSAIKVIILTTFDDNESISKVLDNGADGYILKDIKDEDLIRTIKSTVNGYSIIQQSVFKSIKSQYKVNTMNTGLKINLSEREIEIIKLIVDGKDNKQIAVTLYLVDGTVRNTISSILDKLKLKDRTQLAVFAIKNDLV